MLHPNWGDKQKGHGPCSAKLLKQVDVIYGKSKKGIPQEERHQV